MQPNYFPVFANDLIICICTCIIQQHTIYLFNQCSRVSNITTLHFRKLSSQVQKLSIEENASVISLSLRRNPLHLFAHSLEKLLPKCHLKLYFEPKLGDFSLYRTEFCFRGDGNCVFLSFCIYLSFFFLFSGFTDHLVLVQAHPSRDIEIFSHMSLQM